MQDVTKHTTNSSQTVSSTQMKALLSLPQLPTPLTIELALLNNLDFQGIPAECRDFIRLIYLTKLNKVP